MLKFLFIFFACVVYINTASDQCASFDTLTPDQIWVTIRPLNFQNYFIISFGLLSVICLILTISTWAIYKSFSVPSDIMFAICCSELIQNSSLVVSSFYFLLHQQDRIPNNFPTACTVVSILYTIGNTSSLIYNVVFCLVLSVSIRKTLKGSLFSQVRYHALILISVSIITLSLALAEVTSSGFSGICGYKLQNRQSFARFFGDMLVVSICIFSMVMFKKKIPKSTYFKKVSVFGFYYYYMGFFIVIQAISSTWYLIGNIACLLNSSTAPTLILISTTFGSCSSIVLSYVLMSLRFAHPLLRMKIKKAIERKRNKNEFQPQEDDLEDRPWLGSLIQSIRGSQIISFLTGIVVCFAQHQNKIIRQENISNFSYKKNYLVKLNEEITDQYIIRRISDRQSLIVKHKLEGMRPMPYSVKFYCAQIFSSLLAQQQDINIFHSFNINQNMSLVKQKSCTDGGKSGQFFFGTYDNKFIIKTVSQDEAILYLQKIKQFYEYFKKNRNTMIAKILGLYKFMRTDVIQQPIYFILMRNVSPYDKNLQLRVYDIKGSQFNRSTIDQRKIDNQNQEKFRNHTLKDLDFMKLQHKISIEPGKAKQLGDQLKRDAKFLGQMQVMDYSILIIKRKGKMRDQNTKIIYKYNEFPCYTSKDQYYNIGIIDYLQSWTLRKKAQRAFKTMITKKQVTVTSPGEYSKRLSQFVDEIL